MLGGYCGGGCRWLPTKRRSCGWHAGGGPQGRRKKAIELYDRDGNGSLDETELAACPGIHAARERYDADGDRAVSQNEISARLTAMYSSGTPWMSAVCRVYQGGKPLAGAKVRFLPEPFLAETLKPATGTTDGDGTVLPAVSDDELPVDKRCLRIMQPGIYRVEIEHPSIKQSAAPLGCEIDPAARGGSDPVFRL